MRRADVGRRVLHPRPRQARRVRCGEERVREHPRVSGGARIRSGREERQRRTVWCSMQTRAVCTAWLLASMGLLLSTPSAIASTGARDPALERDARALVRTTTRVHRAIDSWRAQENPSTRRPPLAVELTALAQQRLVIRLTPEPHRAAVVLAHVRGPLRPHVVATV